MSTFYPTSDERRQSAFRIMRETVSGLHSPEEGSRLVKEALRKGCRCGRTFVACNHPEADCRSQNQDPK